VCIIRFGGVTGIIMIVWGLLLISDNRGCAAFLLRGYLVIPGSVFWHDI